ncbi:MAG: DUF4091 domain-containing protein [Candidatus Hydrogenedentes bacterium]|nr:DUF4091 domain-containing protein [Candidatus Hydrogenedentota bacterium]
MCKGKAVTWILALNAAMAGAQVIPVPNGAFDTDPAAEPSWTLSGGPGKWIADDRAITVTGTGEDSNSWRTGPLPLEPSALYLLRFRARTVTSPAGGTAMTGPQFANRDLGVPPVEWQEYTTVFLTPSNLTADMATLRFGQWRVPGTLAFDDVSLCVAQAVHAAHGDIALGKGESVSGNDYSFHSPLAGSFGNYARPLVSQACAFNTNRWTVTDGSEIVYRHAIGARNQRSATVRVNISEYTAGTLRIEARAADSDWMNVGEMTESGILQFAIPPDLFPANSISVRLRGEGSDSAFILKEYAYESEFDGDPLEFSGDSRLLAVDSVDPQLGVTCTDFGDARPGGTNVIAARIENRTQSALPLNATVTIVHRDGEQGVFEAEIAARPGESLLEVPYTVTRSGEYRFDLRVDGAGSFHAQGSFHVPVLYDATYGERLPQSNEDIGVWWASSGWKISTDRPLPEAVANAILIRAARNEAEAAQLVVRPARDLKGLTAAVGELRGPNGAIMTSNSIDVLRVRYVDVTIPTDHTGAIAPWPDPLPPLNAPLDISAGMNQPLWIRVHVPRDAKPGLYEGNVQLSAEGYESKVPLQVEVYGFDLPDRPTCTSAFGFSPGEVYRYHNLTEPSQQREVMDQYLQSFSEHRISPYNPAPLDPFVVTWPGVDHYKQGTTSNLEEAFTPTIDWTAWDTAMTKAMDNFGFTSFQLPIIGMGGGTFHARTEPSLLGYTEDTPEYQAAFANYCRQVEAHLRDKGWLDEAYVYWFDEPDPKDYDFVMNGFRKIREAAPGIPRMLTEQVEPELIGGPTLWCPISDAFDMEDAEVRRAEGEKFWWYVCTWPTAPYCGLFIDHPGTALRVWLWQTWQRKIDGILIWQSNYWTSNTAFPDEPQNPYADPMGWTTGYGTPPGVKLPWGNGDGRFMYPPEAAADGSQSEAVLAGPVDSIRWEMLRDGVEDYEYLAILRGLLEDSRAEAVGEAELNEYRALLEVPDAITASMTNFTLDPAPIEARRNAIARAIEHVRTITE